MRPAVSQDLSDRPLQVTMPLQEVIRYLNLSVNPVVRLIRGVLNGDPNTGAAPRWRVANLAESATLDLRTVSICGTLSSAATWTLPDGLEGDWVMVKAPSNAGAFNLTIDGGNANIDGAATLVLATNYESRTLIHNGTEWSVFA